jgi:hypothetical protein
MSRTIREETAMNFAGILFASLIPLIVFGVAWIFGRPLAEETSPHPAETIEDLLPLHTRHFPQLRRSLDSADARYIHRKISKELERSWCCGRRQIVRDYLTGLAGDFARVLRLAGIVDSLSPTISRRNVVGRYWLALRFRFFYRVIALCMSAGGPRMLRQIARLTAYVGSLSALEEAAMERLEIFSGEEEVHSNFNA